MRVIGLTTGSVRIKSAQVVGRGPLRVLTTMVSRAWTDWLPINFWAIEHRDGTILVDVGESPRASEPGYLPSWHPYYRLAVRMDVKPDEGPASKLRNAGIDPESVQKIVLTHLHTDHVGGIADFPNAKIFATAREIRDFDSVRGRLFGGCLPGNAPDWFAPEPLEFDGEQVDPFGASATITDDGAVLAVNTPGHTPGHCSVIVRDSDGRTLFLAGDASYTLDALKAGTVDGVSPSKRTAARTLARIRSFIGGNDAVYLPTHDPSSIDRLNAAGPMSDDQQARPIPSRP